MLDKNYETVEATALYALTAIMKDYLTEIASKVKENTECQGRTDSNLLDMLNAAHDYGITQ